MSLKTSKKVVNWGIIGLGDVCAKKSGPAFWKCDNSKLVAVMRRTPGKAKRWVKDNVPGGDCVGYDDIHAFLNHDGLDAVYIATPPGNHLEVVKRVAEVESIKACYVEKPVGRCGAETEEMVKLFRDKLFYPAYISRAYDRTNKVKELIDDGVTLGDVVSVSYTFKGTGGIRGLDTSNIPWRVDAAQSGGGLIMDVGCHLIDRLDYLLGPLTNVTGTAINTNSLYDVEDYVELHANIDRTTVTCTWNFAPAQDEECDELIINGSNGNSLSMAAMSPSLPVHLINDHQIVKTFTFDTPEHTAQPLIQLVTHEICGIDSAMSPARGDNAIRTSKVLDTILLDYYGNRKPGFWSQNWPRNNNS